MDDTADEGWAPDFRYWSLIQAKGNVSRHVEQFLSISNPHLITLEQDRGGESLVMQNIINQ